MLARRVLRCSSGNGLTAVGRRPLALALTPALATPTIPTRALSSSLSSSLTRTPAARPRRFSPLAASPLICRPPARHVPARWYTSLGRSKLPTIHNEPILTYVEGSPERDALIAALKKTKSECPDIPCIVAGKEIRNRGPTSYHVMPSLHSHPVCTFHEADESTARAAVDAALAAKSKWEQTSFDTRATIFLKAADLLSGKYRAQMCAAIMLGQSKTVWQAEIDTTEMADFWRFNAKYAEEIYATQPSEHSPTVWNRMQFRPLEGFVVVISPFNFAAIGATPSTPAILGNTVVWKPSALSVLANYLTYQILIEAGLPAGVINFLPSTSGSVLTNTAFNHPLFAGLHFTGATSGFNHLWKLIANNLELYRSYPRVVGETGGKNYHMVHPSADVELVVHQTIRAAFEYQGQSCSSLSRAYFPSNLWPKIQQRLVQETSKLQVSQPDDFDAFVCAVIDEKAFDRVSAAIERARTTPGNSIIAGGTYDKSKGYFIQPTIIVTTDSRSETMVKELLGPVLTCYVYPEDEFEQTLTLVDTTSPYALTGSLFATDRYALDRGSDVLRNSSGNFYLNEKCTASVVGQQAFGGARGSGTNDKSGSGANLIRWVSQRSIKETTVPITTWRYPHMEPEPEPASATTATTKK